MTDTETMTLLDFLRKRLEDASFRVLDPFGNVIAGREGYEVTGGEVLYRNKDLLELEPEERACEGIFLAFQYPVEIPGVNNTYFLRSALNAQRKYRGEEELDAVAEFLKYSSEIDTAGWPPNIQG